MRIINSIRVDDHYNIVHIQLHNVINDTFQALIACFVPISFASHYELQAYTRKMTATGRVLVHMLWLSLGTTLRRITGS